jgi:hypothetical protein
MLPVMLICCLYFWCAALYVIYSLCCFYCCLASLLKLLLLNCLSCWFVTFIGGGADVYVPVLLLCLFAGVATAVISLLDIQPNISGGFTGKGGLATAF